MGEEGGVVWGMGVGLWVEGKGGWELGGVEEVVGGGGGWWGWCVWCGGGRFFEGWGRRIGWFVGMVEMEEVVEGFVVLWGCFGVVVGGGVVWVGGVCVLWWKFEWVEEWGWGSVWGGVCGVGGVRCVGRGWGVLGVGDVFGIIGGFFLGVWFDFFVWVGCLVGGFFGGLLFGLGLVGGIFGCLLIDLVVVLFVLVWGGWWGVFGCLGGSMIGGIWWWLGGMGDCGVVVVWGWCVGVDESGDGGGWFGVGVSVVGVCFGGGWFGGMMGRFWGCVLFDWCWGCG
uniref:Uncharacterized protein n=1 Tax=Knipowitschia caucasica TaxID=637954 RepID=A0AAV2KS65_KNICA